MRLRALVPPAQVPGCSAELSLARAYFKRCRICELHARQSEVTIRGSRMRFCQQARALRTQSPTRARVEAGWGGVAHQTKNTAWDVWDLPTGDPSDP